MSKLIVVSNRVPRPQGEPKAGGLATALGSALAERSGLWAGWSGRTSPTATTKASIECNGQLTLATVDLREEDFDGYYNRLSNCALWPAFHGRLDLVHIDQEAYDAYRRVNRQFAEAIHPLCGPEDTVWVQDYHLIPLGHELQKLGLGTTLGFFLHIPFPPPETFAALPWAKELAGDLAAYDMVGFQTPVCCMNFLEYVDRHIPNARAGKDRVSIGGRTVKIQTHPIGIDTNRFVDLANSPAVASRARRMKQCLHGRTGIAGVERLDYSKGIAERFRALETLLEQHPHYQERVTLYQIASPSRLGVPEYQTMQAELEGLSGHVNGRFATFDWAPIRYINRTFSQSQIAALYRACRVGLVTPLRDGMNLVAKEYIAAQSPDDPGVLVLSCFAGAAQELTDAVTVNPYDIESTAEALLHALEMPLAERQQRWKRMMRQIETHDVHHWWRGYLDALSAARRERGPQVAA